MKFSIIIPCYKVERYVRECLDSVLTQKCESWEAICTDDGSPGGTVAILDEYREKVVKRGEGEQRMVVIHHFIERFLQRDERIEAWRHWFGSMEEAATFVATMSLWRRFTIKACRLFPFRLLPLMLCCFPHWLKCRGIHRR